MLHRQVMLLSAIFLGSAFAQQNNAVCEPVYKPFNLHPTVYDHINFVEGPINLGTGPGQYDWILNGGVIGTDGLFDSTTDDPGVIMSNTIWPVPSTGEIQATATFNYTSTLLSGSINSPLGISEDPFYGCAYFGVEDVEDGWRFAIVMTQGKVYALYARMATDVSLAGFFKLFAYLVPIWSRSPTDPAIEYSIVLNADRFTASYRVEGAERLLIQNLGMPIDQRFLIQCAGGYNEGPAFPRNLQLVLGNLPLGLWYSGSPHTACQNAMFNECTQSPYNAYLTFCQYAPLQNTQVVPYNIEMFSTWINWSLMHWDIQSDCHTLGQPCARPDLYCPGESDSHVCGCSLVEEPVSTSDQLPPCPRKPPCTWDKPRRRQRRYPRKH